MKILVLVKQVPDTSEIQLNKETNTLDRENAKAITNPDDLAGVEEALRLREQFGGTVTTVTMGPLQAKNMIQELYALGIDHAALITDRAFGGSDTLATSTIISEYIKRYQPDYDLIIAGYQAIDGDTAQVGPQIAELLDIPQATYLQKIRKYDKKNKTIVVEKRYEDHVDVLELPLPALITTLADMNTPRLLNTWDIMTSQDKLDNDLQVITYEEMPIDREIIGLKGSPTKVSGISNKQAVQKSPAEVLSPEEAAEKIAKLVYPYIEVNK